MSLLLTQSPAGDKVNYIQLLLNRDNVPTTLMKTHQVRTRGSKYAFLQLSSREMQPGMWFMKVCPHLHFVLPDIVANAC